MDKISRRLKILRWVWILPLVILCSCEGFKVLSLENKSESDIRIIVKPSLGEYSRANIANYPAYQALDSTSVFLEPDSSLLLLSTFTSMMFNVKIKERDLRANYLRIEMEHDTIVADSKEAIIKLIYGKSESGLQSKGRNIVNLRVY